MRGRTKSKRMSRKVSMWMRSILRKRLAFKVKARGSRRQAVASADTSQECSQCGFTAKDNRHGDHFRCLWCGTIDAATGTTPAPVVKQVGLFSHLSPLTARL